MNDSKWIQDLTAATPVAEAAKRVLELRFGAVRHYLPRALRAPDQDVEHVHQLRVATRRARAALDIFADCLPKSSFRTAKKQLRKIRRAAGEARDWDVFLATLTGSGARWGARQLPGRDLLIGHALTRRRAAQVELERLGEDYPGRFEEVQAEVLAAVESNSEQSVLKVAEPWLARLLHELAQALAGDLDDPRHLHQVRIVGKRLRYALEVFAGCLSPSVREQLYPAVEEMQDILGVANDSQVACTRLEEVAVLLNQLPARFAKRFQPGVAALRLFHEQRLRKQRGDFMRWRERWRRLGGMTALTASV
jgi:CHAD domain-containing protein